MSNATNVHYTCVPDHMGQFCIDSLSLALAFSVSVSPLYSSSTLSWQTTLASAGPDMAWTNSTCGVDPAGTCVYVP